MSWDASYDLFLFDMDGLLVNTEELHYRAYCAMCAGKKVTLEWDFPTYCQKAHYRAEWIEEALHQEYPALFLEATWQELYAEKSKHIRQFFSQGQIALMPGVELFLRRLLQQNKPCAVVTHSAVELVSEVRQQHPILNAIPVWVTRRDYTHPKPHPECYTKALEKLSCSPQRAIGFEDTPRGLAALQASGVQPVLISQINYPEIPFYKLQGMWHFPTFLDLMATHIDTMQPASPLKP